MASQRKNKINVRNLMSRVWVDDFDGDNEEIVELSNHQVVSWLLEGGDRVHFSGQKVRWVNSDEWELELVPHVVAHQVLN